MDTYAAYLAEGTRKILAPSRRRARHVRCSRRQLLRVSPAYRDLATSSKANYRRVIDGFLQEHGHRKVDQIRREHIDAIIGKMANKPGAGIVLLKRIRTVCALCHRGSSGSGTTRPWARPATAPKSFTPGPRRSWQSSRPGGREGSRQRLAYALLLYTGQRGSDVYRMSYAHIDNDTIEVAQQKTGQEDSDEKLVIPMHRNLRRELTLAKREHVVILTTAYGQPFSVKGFGNFVSDAIKAAELPARCKAHGLRKAAARRLAEAGCTAKQIQAITGHKSLEEVERYTRKADQMLLARQAVAKQENNGGS